MSPVVEATRDEIEAAFPLVRELTEPTRGAVVRLWQDMLLESPWEGLADCPYSPERPGVSLVAHTNAVTEAALALLQTEERHGDGRVTADRQLVIAIGLLHDVSKLVEHEPCEGGCRLSELGRRLQHAVYAAHKAMALGVPLDVVEVLVNHTPQSGRHPESAEGLLIYYADAALGDLSRWANGKPLHVARSKGQV